MIEKLKISQPKNKCECDVLDMCPERISINDNDKFSHICMKCKGGITDNANRDYNEYWGYSGFDEYPDVPQGGDDD